MGKQWQQWQTLFSWAPESLQMVTAAMKLKAPCSLEEKLWHLDIILKSRDITLPIKVHLVKAMVFPVVTYECESWTIKKAECRRIDAFELWCWKRLLRVPGTAMRSNQSVLKEISPEYSSEGLMMKLKLQYFGYLIKKLTPWKRPWCWERLKAGGEGDDRDERLDGNTNLMDMSLSNYRTWEAWRAAVHGVAKSWRQLSDWTELNFQKEIMCQSHYYCMKNLPFFSSP